MIDSLPAVNQNKRLLKAPQRGYPF